LTDEISNQLYEHFGIEKGISKRTFHYDIELMRSLPPRGFDAPIEVKDGYYFYEDPDFSIDNTALTETDIETINNALTLLNNFSKLSINEELALVKAKLLGEVSNQTNKEPIILFEQREVKGAEFISPLFKKINEYSAIALTYKSFRAEHANTFIVHPYLLKQYNHRWYLIGYSSTHQNIGLYSLDRIENIQNTEEKFIPNKFFNPDTYFNNIIGVTIPENEDIREIKIKVYSAQVPYVLTKPIHSSQKVISESKEYAIISLSIIPNYEFFSRILSFGNELEILEPGEIREIVIKKTQYPKIDS
jgi:predicted DNA-binding transcriptional regulator YafY